MADLLRGTTFADTSPNNAANGARMNALVDSATILPGAIGDKTVASSLAGGDALMLLQASSGALRQALMSVLATYVKSTISAPASPITQVILQNGMPDSAYETPRFAWISVRSGRNVGNDGIQLWDADASPPCWRYIQTVPLGVIVQFAGSHAWDGTGLGNVGGQLDGWAYCNGNNGTTDMTGTGTFIQFVGYPT